MVKIIRLADLQDSVHICGAAAGDGWPFDYDEEGRKRPSVFVNLTPFDDGLPVPDPEPISPEDLGTILDLVEGLRID